MSDQMNQSDNITFGLVSKKSTEANRNQEWASGTFDYLRENFNGLGEQLAELERLLSEPVDDVDAIIPLQPPVDSGVRSIQRKVRTLNEKTERIRNSSVPNTQGAYTRIHATFRMSYRAMRVFCDAQKYEEDPRFRFQAIDNERTAVTGSVPDIMILIGQCAAAGHFSLEAIHTL